MDALEWSLFFASCNPINGSSVVYNFPLLFFHCVLLSLSFFLFFFFTLYFFLYLLFMYYLLRHATWLVIRPVVVGLRLCFCFFPPWGTSVSVYKCLISQPCAGVPLLELSPYIHLVFQPHPSLWRPAHLQIYLTPVHAVTILEHVCPAKRMRSSCPADYVSDNFAAREMASETSGSMLVWR